MYARVYIAPQRYHNDELKQLTSKANLSVNVVYSFVLEISQQISILKGEGDFKGCISFADDYSHRQN